MCCSPWNDKLGRQKGEVTIDHENRAMSVMLAPSIIFVFIASIIPLIYTFALSVQDYTLTNPSGAHFNGLENYIQLFLNADIRHSIYMTMMFTFSSVVLSMVIGLALAVLVNKLDKGRTFFRVVVFLPMMLSPVVIGVVWRFLLNYELGVFNYLAERIGLNPVNWLGNPSFAMASIILGDVWQWSSYTFILALAALESMDPSPIEAANIDGASSLQVFRHVTLPLITPTLKIAAVFRIVWAFRNFDLIYALTKGGPGNATETMAVGIWKLAFTRYDIGVSSALSVLMFFILMGLSVILLRSKHQKAGESL
jgi:multiple sugar transport system permease protein